MATYTIRGATGVDGTAIYKTATALFAAFSIGTGDIINVSERLPPQDLSAYSLLGIIWQQELGRTQGVFDGGRAVPATWTAATGNGWQNNIGAGLAVTAVTVAYSQQADGRYFGFIDHVANSTLVGTTDNSWFYDSASGILYVNDGTNAGLPINPNTIAGEFGEGIAWCTEATALKCNGGLKNCRFTDLWFRRSLNTLNVLNPNVNEGDPFIANGGLSLEVSGNYFANCRFDDAGRHSMALAGLNCANNQVNWCTFSAVNLDVGTLTVVQPEGGSGTTLTTAVNNTFNGCTYYRNSSLGRDGNPVVWAALGGGSNTPGGGYSHTVGENDAGLGAPKLPAGSIIYNSCIVRLLSAQSGSAFDGTNQSTPSDKNDPTTYSVRVIECVIDIGAYPVSGSIAFQQTTINFNSLSTVGMNFSHTAGQPVGFFACAIRGNCAGGDFAVEVLFSLSTNDELIYHTSSVSHSSTSAIHYLSIFSLNGTGTVRAHRCIFGIEAAVGSNRGNYLMTDDVGACTRDFDGNAYFRIQHYGQSGSNDSFAAWKSTTPETNAIEDTTVPWLNASLTLQLNSAHQFYTTLAPAGYTAPTSGILRNPYARTYGAFQKSSTAAGIGGLPDQRAMMYDQRRH